jgi:serpin B
VLLLIKCFAFSNDLEPLFLILGMSKACRLFVSTVVQKAFVEVNEAGTEAAATTALMMMMQCLPPQFNCDCPFLYMIKDNLTGLVLFAGRVTNPTQN